jgi:CRP-like cAMP-binding protein
MDTKTMSKRPTGGTGVPSRYRAWREAKASGAIRLRFKVALVEKIPLFDGLSEKEVLQLARLVNEREVPAGTELATAGEPGGELFAIVDGEAAVKTKPGRTNTLKAGDFFGEMSLIDGQPRSATVQAVTPLRLLVLGQRDFWRVLDGTTSIARKIMQTLSRRLREAEGTAGH